MTKSFNDMSRQERWVEVARLALEMIQDGRFRIRGGDWIIYKQLADKPCGCAGGAVSYALAVRRSGTPAVGYPSYRFALNHLGDQVQLLEYLFENQSPDRFNPAAINQTETIQELVGPETFRALQDWMRAARGLRGEERARCLLGRIVACGGRLGLGAA